ncbi:MAG: hypothetical protein ACYCTY_15575, partial [Sulfuricella sp.]
CESSLVGDQVVGSQHQQAGLFAMRGGDLQCGGGDGGCGVASDVAKRIPCVSSARVWVALCVSESHVPALVAMLRFRA